jgi:hypothetical protein
MKRWLMFGLVAMHVASGQKIETLKADRARITRVETAVNHLTVIEVADPIEQVAAGSPTFRVEWRGNKVFVQPLEPDAATNLFIWTPSSRLSYELVSAGSVEKMHFAIDQEPTKVAIAAPPLPLAKEQPRIPNEMLYKAITVKFAGTPDEDGRVAILLRDLFEKDGKIYVRYSIRNQGKASYQPATPAVVVLNSPSGTQSLYVMRRTQLGENLAGRITAKSLNPVKVVHSEIGARLLAPGEEAVGLLAFEAASAQAPVVLRFRFPAERGRDVVATLVL